MTLLINVIIPSAITAAIVSGLFSIFNTWLNNYLNSKNKREHLFAEEKVRSYKKILSLLMDDRTNEADISPLLSEINQCALLATEKLGNLFVEYIRSQAVLGGTMAAINEIEKKGHVVPSRDSFFNKERRKTSLLRDKIITEMRKELNIENC